MNPEEGDLRPQLLDRFAFAVDIHGLTNPVDRVAIMERNLRYEAEPDSFCAEWQPREKELTDEIDEGRKIVEKVTYSARDLQSIAALTTSLGVDGHRADLVILRAARAQAAFAGRTAITDEDVVLAAELALPHRIKHGPFQKTEVSVYDLQERMEQIRDDAGATEGKPMPSEDKSSVKKNRA
jgi:magnesium chelatase subunit I